MTDFIRVPPDSTGKRVRNDNRTDIVLASEPICISIDDVLTGQTSCATGTVSGVARHNPTVIYLKDVCGTFAPCENLRIGSCTYGVVTSGPCAVTTTYTQNFVNTDRDNPQHTQKIDAKGAANVRFTEGRMQFDAFGRAMVSESTLISSSSYVGRNDVDDYCDVTVTCGTLTHLTCESMLRLQTTTASGSRAMRTSKLYNPYQPGIGTYLLFAGNAGDTGKSNLTRRWGIFDDCNGIFFSCIDGTLNVSLRSDTTGCVVDTHVPICCWNGEKVDGSPFSVFTLDKTKGNLYWIDFEWQGVGRVRYGMVGPNGERVTAHTIENANANNGTYMRNPTLPVRVEQVNTGITSGTSDFKVSSHSVYSDGKPQWQTHPMVYSGICLTSVAFCAGEVPLVSLRAKTTLNCVPVRGISHLTGLKPYTDSGAVRINVYKNACLTGACFSSAGTDSFLEVDTSTSSISCGKLVDSFIIGINEAVKPLREKAEAFNTVNTIFLNPDGTTREPLTITAERLDTSGTSNVTVVLNWDELH